MDILKVSSKSNPNSCAGALAGVIRQAGAAELHVVGAGALNQAVKAIAIARGFLASAGLDLVCVPMFADIEIDGESRTAIRLLVEDRSRRHLAAPTGASGAGVGSVLGAGLLSGPHTPALTCAEPGAASPERPDVLSAT